MKDFKDRLQNILETNFGTKDNNFALLKNNIPPSGFEQLKKKKNEYRNEINLSALNSYSCKSKMLTQNNNKDKSSSLNKLSNIRSMILNENKDNFRGINPSVKSSIENKFQAYETINTNTCSPKNSFYLNSLNSSSLPGNKNELRNSVLSTDANYNNQNASKLRNSLEKFTSDFLKGTITNTHTNSNSNSKHNRIHNYFDHNNNNYNSQNTNPNINRYSTGNSQVAYQDLLIQQQENRFAKMKKEKILSLLDERPAAYDKHINNLNKGLSNRNSTDRSAGKNYFSASVYASQVKSPKNNLENNHFYNSILHENPDIKKRIELANGNSNKNGLSNNTSGYNIENFGLLPTSNNSSFNVLNSNNNTNAGKEFTEFLNASKNKQNKDFHHNFINSPLKSNLLNGNNAASRNSLKNLNAVKSQLENLFEKNERKETGYNNAMDNLCAFLNHKNKKANGANIQHTDKSVKLMEEIKDMRKSISNNRAKSANRPTINPTSPSNSKNNTQNKSGYLNTVFAFSPTTNKSVIKANTSNFILNNNQHKSIFSANTNVNISQNLNSGGNILNTSLNTSNYFLNKNNKANNSNYFRDLNNQNTLQGLNLLGNNNSNNMNVSGNYGRSMVPTYENYHNNYNLHTLSDLNSNYTSNNSANKFNLNKKNAVGSILNTIINDESVEEFSSDLENPNRKDSLIMKYMKKKKLTL